MEFMQMMSKKKNEGTLGTGRRREAVEVKTVHYGTKPLVDCMKAVIKIHMNKRA